MKKRIFITLATSLIATGTFASVCHFHPGLVSCGPGIYNGNLSTDSPTVINGTTITGLTHVDGPLRAKGNSNLEGGLKVDGPANFNQSQVQGNTSIDGSLNAQQTTFQGNTHIDGPIVANGSKFTATVKADTTYMSYKASSVQAIEATAPGKITVCDLSGSDLGNINFTQGSGVVYLGSGSSVGSVTGGTIVHSDSCPRQF